MATLNELFNLRFESSTLRNRVTVAIAKACKTVILEDAGTANHAARLVWAKQALGNMAGAVDEFLWAVVVVLADPAAATDAQIEATVLSVVNVFATD